MGCVTSSAVTVRVVLVGLDNAGKSSILHCLTEGKSQHNPRPTIGYQQATIHRSKMEIQIWDVGGDAKGRDLWRHYIKGANAVIFVVDSGDEYHLDECGDECAKNELHNVLKNDELPFTSPLLIYSNKQDKKGALNQTQIEQRLELKEIKSRSWHIQPSCALNCNGIEDGIDWLCEAIQRQLKAAK